MNPFNESGEEEHAGTDIHDFCVSGLRGIWDQRSDKLILKMFLGENKEMTPGNKLHSLKSLTRV